MKKSLFTLLMLMIVVSPVAFGKQPDSAQSQPSSAQRDGVKVYSSQGYYVKAKNYNDGARYYSFTYVVTGYDSKGAVVSKTEETMKDLFLEGEEERNLFTAPTDPKKEIAYWVTITDVSGVRGTGASGRRRR